MRYMKITTESAKNNTRKYLVSRLAGANKQESALSAGYSENVAKQPSLIERTNAYAIQINEILNTNASTLSETMQELRTVILLKPVDWNMALKIADVATKQSKIHDVLTPKVTLKQSTDKNGNVTRTAWAQNASQVQEVLDDGQEVEG